MTSLLQLTIRDGKSHRQPQLITIQTKDKENILINKLAYKQTNKQKNKILTQSNRKSL